MSFGGGKKPVSQQPTKALGIDFQGAQYGPPIPVVYGKNKVAGNCIWYGDFQAIAQQQKQSSGKGGGGSSSTTSYVYKASYQLALCEGPVSGITTVYNGTSVTTTSAVGGTVALGSSGQAAWAHLTGSAALGYSNTALISFQNRSLGSSASLPNDNFEVKGLLPFGSGIDDADPSVIFNDILSDTQHGMAGVITTGSLTQMHNYCVAAGIFFSPVYDQQDTAQSALEDLLTYSNCEAWFSEGVLKVGCYGDQTITGNGVTYTPNNTAVATLGPDDFITNGNTPPITITRKSPAAAVNLVRIEFKDRSNTYHDSAVVASFDEDMIANGTRSDDSESVDMITSAGVAQLVSQNLLQREYYIRNQYEFKLSWQWCYLEPFDIVEITDPLTGLTGFPVRVLSVEEDEHGLLDFTAEEYPLGVGHAATYGTQPNAGTTVDPDADPGPVAGPYLFRGPGFLCKPGQPEIWCAVTGNGNPLWAGCDVYISYDGTSYTYLTSYARMSRYGELTTTLPVGSDPDTTHTPNVVLNNGAVLNGCSHADADNFASLSMIDGEIIAYSTATLTAGPSYNLAGYMRRGGYGTAIAAHAVNAPFVRLDDGILRVPVDPSQIGQTVYFKFLSVNCFGRSPRTLSGETAYSYVIGSRIEYPDVPNIPDSFTVTPVADGVSITWSNDNPAAVGCTSIEFATASGGPFTVLAQVGPTTTGYHHGFATGATYYYRARSRGYVVSGGWSAYTAVISSTGVNVSGTGGLVTQVNSNVPLVNNPQFATGDLTGWTSDHGSFTYQSGTNGPAGGTSSYAIRTGSSGTPSDALRNTAKIPVYTGTLIKAQCAIKGSGSPGGNAVVRVSWRDWNNLELSNIVGNTISGNVTGTSYVTATAPSGAAWAHIEGQSTHTSGSYAFDNFAASILIDTLDQLPDGSVQISTKQYATAETVDNANFEASTVLPPPGWQAAGASGTASAALAYNTGAPYSGTQSLRVTTSITGTAGVKTTRQYKCTPGDVYLVNAEVYGASAGVTVGLQFWNTSTGFVSYGAGGTRTTTSFGLTGGQVTVPAGADYFYVIVYTSGSIGIAFYVDDVALSLVRNLDTQVADGTNYGRTSNLDLYSSGGFNRIGLRVAASGQQIGGQANLLPVTVGSIRSRWDNSMAVSASFTGALPSVVTFTTTASNLQIGSSSVAYSASSASTTQGRSTDISYFLYYLDPAFAGGSQTLYYTTDPNLLATADGVIWVGSVEVVIPSTGSGSGGGVNGGGCVAIDQYLPDGVQAGRVVAMDQIAGCEIDLATRDYAVNAASLSIQPCFELRTAKGGVVVASASTPMTLPDGSLAMFPDMLGKPVAILKDGVAEWDECVSLAEVGLRPVNRISIGGNCYWAGAKPGVFVLTHNTVQVPK